MIAHHATEKRRGFEVGGGGGGEGLNEGSEDSVNEVAGSMATKPSCCGNIDRCRDAGQWFSITSDRPSCIWFSTSPPPQKKVLMICFNQYFLCKFNNMLLVRFPPVWNCHQCFYLSQIGNAWFMKASSVLLLSSIQKQPDAPAASDQQVQRTVSRAELPASLGLELLCLTGSSSARSTRPSSLFFKAILMQDLRELYCNQPLRASARTSFH